MPDADDPNANPQPYRVDERAREIVGGSRGIRKFIDLEAVAPEEVGRAVYRQAVKDKAVQPPPDWDEASEGFQTDGSSGTSWQADASSVAADTPSAPHVFFHPGAGGRRPTAERSFGLLPTCAQPAGDDPVETPSPEPFDLLVVNPMQRRPAVDDPVGALSVGSVISRTPERSLNAHRPPPVHVGAAPAEEHTPPPPGAAAAQAAQWDSPTSPAHYSDVLRGSTRSGASPDAGKSPLKPNTGAGPAGPG